MEAELTTLEKIEKLKTILVVRATEQGGFDPGNFALLRGQLLRDARIKARLPGFLKTCSNLTEFWAHIKGAYSTYRERRGYIQNEFLPAITYLESLETAPMAGVVEQVLRNTSSEAVSSNWQRALERCNMDPAAAITSARSLAEAVLKYILEERHQVISDDDDLPKLYKTAAKTLNLAPEQHQVDVFKRILGGCENVITGLGSLRNKAGDAHGRKTTYVKPSSRHAELAVNLAGSMALFLIRTHEQTKPEGK
jgi:Abortive infection C-terminus